VSTVPIELPVKPREAAALADLIFQVTEGHRLGDEVRNRINGRLGSLELTGMVPFIGSLQKDPVHSSAYYVAVDANAGPRPTSLLLRMALASSPASAHFPDPILIGRMRPGGGREIVVNAIPFAVTDRENIRTFASRIDRSFYPRPQGPQSAIAVSIEHPESGIPAAFEAFRTISRKYGVNWASITAGPEASTEDVYCTSLWASIRAGWREGYTVGVNLPAEAEAAKEAAAAARGYTRFVVNTNPGQVFDSISAKYFDFEYSFAQSAEPTTPKALAKLLDSLKTNGHPAQLVAPKLTGSEDIAELAAVARQFNATLSLDAGVPRIGRATGGRFNVTVAEGTAESIVSLAADLRT
jgi:hypothetical protein